MSYGVYCTSVRQTGERRTKEMLQHVWNSQLSNKSNMFIQRFIAMLNSFGHRDLRCRTCVGDAPHPTTVFYQRSSDFKKITRFYFIIEYRNLQNKNLINIIYSCHKYVRPLQI